MSNCTVCIYDEGWLVEYCARHMPECLEDYGNGECSGDVEFRMALSPTGKSYPRCDGHWVKRMREQERIVRTYGGKFAY